MSRAAVRTERAKAKTFAVWNAVKTEGEPTPEWLLLVGDTLASVFLNDVLSDEELPTARDDPLFARLQDLRRRLEATVSHYRRRGPSPRTVGAAPVVSPSLSTEVDKPEDLLREIHDFVWEIQGRIQPPDARTAEPRRLVDYERLFRTIPLPLYATEFQSDDAFVVVRLAGTAPMSLRGVTKPELLNLVGDRISDADFNAILSTTGDSVELAGESGRLCVADYHTLSATVPFVVPGQNFVVDPVAVFAEPLHGNDVIKPVAIQLGQSPGESEFVLANTEDAFLWQIAKTTVQCADTVYHSIGAHSARLHQVLQAFSVATQCTLKVDHPLSRLLRPHIEGTEYANSDAAAPLLSPQGSSLDIYAKGNLDRMISLGTLRDQELGSLDFEQHAPDVEFEARRIDRLKVFPYRDDALEVWNAVLKWTGDYVELYYEDDAFVLADPQLSAWATEIAANGSFLGFRPPQTKAALTRVLALVVFMASAEHAALHFAQKEFTIYAPSAPGGLWGEITESRGDALAEEQWLRMLPPLDVASLQQGALHIAGGVRYRRLGEYTSNEFPYYGTLEVKAAPALDAFRRALKSVEEKIKDRNAKRGALAYEYLLPSKIPASINV